MAILVMAVFDTDSNGRSEYTEKSLWSLLNTVDFSKHRLFISDNGSCSATHSIYQELERVFPYPDNLIINFNGDNLGTAKAVNLGLKIRNPGEHCIKIDNDCVVNQTGWVEEMEAAITRDNTLGIVGLKRKDIDFDPTHENPSYRSQLICLPHKVGQSWILVEKGTYIMGTCTMFNSLLIDNIGVMAQPGVYGIDDTLYSLRSELAGFWNCYMPHINIDHIDTGENSYTQVKQKQASGIWDIYMQWHQGYIDGTKDLYYDGN